MEKEVTVLKAENAALSESLRKKMQVVRSHEKKKNVTIGNVVLENVSFNLDSDTESKQNNNPSNRTCKILAPLLFLTEKIHKDNNNNDDEDLKRLNALVKDIKAIKSNQEAILSNDLTEGAQKEFNLIKHVFPQNPARFKVSYDGNLTHVSIPPDFPEHPRFPHKLIREGMNIKNFPQNEAPGNTPTIADRVKNVSDTGELDMYVYLIKRREGPFRWAVTILPNPDEEGTALVNTHNIVI